MTIYPDGRQRWSEQETSRLIRAWSEVAISRPARSDFSDVSLVKQIRALLEQWGSAPRSRDATRCHIRRLKMTVRFLHQFNKEQQEAGSRLWFDLTPDERRHVKVPGRRGRMVTTLTSENYDTLVQAGALVKSTRGRPTAGTNSGGNSARRRRTNLKHRDCNRLLVSTMEQQHEDFLRVVCDLRKDVEHEVRQGAEVLSAVFIDQFGEPEDDEQSALVARLMTSYKQQVRERFARVHEDCAGAAYANRELLGQCSGPPSY